MKLEKTERIISIADEDVTTSYYISDWSTKDVHEELLKTYSYLDAGSSYFIEKFEKPHYDIYNSDSKGHHGRWVDFYSVESIETFVATYEIPLIITNESEVDDEDDYEYEYDVLKIFEKVGEKSFVGFLCWENNEILKKKLNAK